MSQWLTSKPAKAKRRNTRSAAARRAANKAHDKLCGAVIALLQSMNVAATHCKATYVKRGDLAYWQPFAGIKGHPDVQGIIVPTGVMLYVECKTGSAVRTPEQIRVCKDLSDAGCLVYVVRDFIDDETADAIRADVSAVRRAWMNRDAL